MANPSNDFQALLAKLQPRSASGTPMSFGSNQQQQQHHQPIDRATSFHQPTPQHMQHGYHQPSVSSPMFSPPINGGPQPRNGSDILSPNVSTPQPNADATAGLLNLLKFSQPAGTPSRPGTGSASGKAAVEGQDSSKMATPSAHTRGISASDLVASFMGKPSPAQASATETFQSNDLKPTSTENPQDFLLKLLNQPKKPSSSSTILPSIEGQGDSPAGNAGAEAVSRGSPMRVFGQSSRETTPFETPLSATKAAEPGIFTYVNPFEQLAASTPRRHTPQPPVTTAKETPVKEASQSQAAPAAEPATAIRSPSVSSKQTETVAQALDEVAGKVDKEVEDALASAIEVEEESDDPAIKQEEVVESIMAVTEDLDEHTVQKLAREVNEELNKPENKGVLEETMPKATAKVVSELIQQAAETELADSWESADGEDSANKGSDTERVVRVLNFPLKPFLGITLKALPPPDVKIREESIMDIARLKKDFDQLDRTLASATTEYIAYSLVKNGGMRIIRQDDGNDKSIFKNTGDRVFNISVCSSSANGPATKEQAVLGTGKSGTVYWATISHTDDDLFERDALEGESLMFPPFPSADENTSGGQLKTRARKSSRHPEYFALGRGKFIHLVFPAMAMNPKYGVSGAQRRVDSEKFFTERSLKITIGKAGKDFAFSEDDTLISSLDKTGRLRFWDIRHLTIPANANAETPEPVDVSTPLLTLATTQPNERSWSTSVLFVDKLRPYVKNCAQRYVLVGLKQNHTIQLWDIALGRAVQELNFPHDNESDPICSIAYHPASGIIVVGHPTRNSIYLIHLSAPRYGIPSMSQATFVQKIGTKDNSLPSPNSTACMSGIRELSFASKGQLRSLELLSVAAPTGAEAEADATLFELYVMHSRGVTCLSIKKEDLGWGPDSKVLHPIDAVSEDLVQLKDLPNYPAQVEEEKSVATESGMQTPIKKPKEIVKKPESAVQSTVGDESRAQSPVKQAPAKKAEKEKVETQPEMTKTEKRKRKKAEKEKEKQAAAAAAAATAKEAEPSSAAANGNAAKAVETVPDLKEEAAAAPEAPEPATATTIAPASATQAAKSGDTISVGISGDFLNKEIKKIEKSVSGEFNKVISRELDALHRRLDGDRRVHDADANAKQESILRLVSSTLTENVEKNLARIVNQAIEKSVVPSVATVTSQVLDKKISDVLSRQLQQAIPREIRASIPDALSRVLNTKEFLSSISDLVATKVAVHVENEFSAMLHSSIAPALSKATAQAADSMHRDVDKHISVLTKRIAELEAGRAADSAKINEMTDLLRGLSNTVATMASVQTEFQNTILAAENERRLNGKVAASQGSSSGQISTPVAPVPVKTDYEIEIDDITTLLRNEQYEEAAIKWLKSRSQTEIFDDVFVRYPTTFLDQLSPLVVLSVAAAVSASFETYRDERLTWLKAIFPKINLHDPDTIDVIPRFFEILIQRLESLYITVAESNRARPTRHNEQLLGFIYPMTQEARAIRNASVSRA